MSIISVENGRQVSDHVKESKLYNICFEKFIHILTIESRSK